MNLLSRMRRAAEERVGLLEIFPTWKGNTEGALSGNRGAFLASPIVHAVIMARIKVFAEVNFTWRNLRTAKTFGTEGLSLLERPWPGGTATELLTRMEMDASLSGNAYVAKVTSRDGAVRLQVLDPERVDVESNGREKVGYAWWRDGRGNGSPVRLLLDEVAHWAPIPHPNKQFLGVAWVEAVLDEIRNDLRMTRHQGKFFENAATPNMFVKVEGTMSSDGREILRSELARRYTGVENAYKTLVMDQGADLKVVGADFHQMDFINVQKSVEGRIASAGGVPPIIVSFRSGLDAATYSNYGMAMRSMADHTIRPAWNSVCAALGQIVEVPGGTELWYDDSHVAALRQDAKDEADIKKTNALTLEALLRSGWTPETSLEAVQSGDMTGLQHTGLMSVQLLPPEDSQPDEPGPDEPEEEE